MPSRTSRRGFEVQARAKESMQAQELFTRTVASLTSRRYSFTTCTRATHTDSDTSRLLVSSQLEQPSSGM